MRRARGGRSGRRRRGRGDGAASSPAPPPFPPCAFPGASLYLSLRADRPGPVPGAAASPVCSAGPGRAVLAPLRSSPAGCPSRWTCPRGEGPAGPGVRCGAGECGWDREPLSGPGGLDPALRGRQLCGFCVGSAALRVAAHAD